MRAWRKLAQCTALAVTVLVTGVAFGDDSSNPSQPSGPPPQPTIQNSPGQPFMMTWPDGREARLKYYFTEIKDFRSHFKITDNDCSDYIKMTCAYTFSLRTYSAKMIWTKNPDASKIGQTVKNSYYTDNSATEVMEIKNAETTGLNPKRPKMGAGLPVHTIACDDWRWLPDATKTAPNSARITRFEGEDTSQNPETGQNENRSQGGINGFELKSVSPDTMKITNVQDLTAFFQSFDILTIDPASSFTIQKANGDICQVGIASNLNAEAANIDTTDHKTPTEWSALPDYIVGQDEMLDSDEVKFEMFNWADGNRKYE